MRIVWLRHGLRTAYLRRMVNDFVLDFERATGLSTVEAPRVLGTAYTTYMQYRDASRALPRYIRAHMKTLLALPLEVREPILEARRHVRL